jgi:hypothetical protein
MTTTAPLTRPARLRCRACHRFSPIGHFSDLVPDPRHLGRSLHIEHDTCRECRHRRILPGRAFR